MPRNTIKNHKGSVIFTSVVAGAALAPILTGQMEHEEKGQRDADIPQLLPSKVSQEISPYSQSLPVLHSVHHLNYTERTKKDGVTLAASSHKQRSTNLDKMATVKEKAFLHLVSDEVLLENDQQISSQSMVSVWPEDTILSIGDEGPKVRTIQKHLAEIGYYVHSIDGMFGGKTFEAIKLYQKDHGLTIDGVVGEETIKHIVGMKQVTENDNVGNHTIKDLSYIYSPDSIETKVYIKQVKNELEEKEDEKDYFVFGDKHEDIIELQELLQEAGYYQGAADGIFGSSTQQAIRSLQRDHHLYVDGIAGEQVFTFLSSHDLEKIAEEREKILEQQEKQRLEEKERQEQAATVNSTSETNTTSSTIEGIISRAKELIGTPYSWGGTSPSGFDCSGFLYYLYNSANKELPRTVVDIWNASTTASSPERGDFVFFETYKKGPSHAGIYLGDGAFIHAGTSQGVTISYLDESYWKSRYLGARSY